MGEYLTIYFGSSTAGPKAVEWDNSMVVGDGSATLSLSKVYELTPDDWATQLTDDGFTSSDILYTSIATFFAASPAPQKLWAYAHVSGDEVDYSDVPLEYVQENTWQIPIKPPSGFAPGATGIEQVKFYHCGENIVETGQINTANGATGIGFTVEKDGAGDWTGQLTFDDGLSGINGVVKPLTTVCNITVDFTAGTKASLSTAITDYNINMISLALENDSVIEQYTDNIFGSQLDDIMTMLNAIAGKNVIFFYALPGGAQPETTIIGTSNKWKELKSLIGARNDVAAFKAIPSALGHNPAVGYMAMTSISHPHKQMTFAEPHFGIQEQEPIINRGKWKLAQIACLMKRTELSGDPYLTTYGFTFGSGDVARIDGIRCRNIIAQSLINNLWALLAKRDTLMSYGGMQKIRSAIRGTFKILIDQRIVDGLVSINIPIEEDLLNNTAAGRLARTQLLVPAVEIEYLWYTGVEKIIITRAENVAT